MYFSKAKEHLQRLLQKKPQYDVIPCSLDDVQNLEDHLRLHLPEAYREFLLWTGGGGGFLAGEEFDWERVRDDNRDKAVGIMQFYNYPNSLPDDAIVFLVYQALNAFAFIRVSEGDDPPVHMFGEREPGNDQMVWNCCRDLEEFCLKMTILRRY
jgi:hypothetical protein